MRWLSLIVLSVVVVLAVSVSQALADSWSDDFSTDTTANYNATYWPDQGSSGGTASILYDSTNDWARLVAVGGYGHIVMERNGASPIPAGDNFSFSADLSIVSEFNGYLYLGDNNPILGTGSCVLWDIGTYTQYATDLQVQQHGSIIYSSPYVMYTPQARNHLEIDRVNDQYSFYCNNTLIWQQAIPSLDGMPLYYGVGDMVSSGPSGVTAETDFGNLSFMSTPEPSTIVLLGVGAVSLLAFAWRKRRAS